MSTAAVEAYLGAEQLEAFHRDGYVVVRRLLSADEVALIRDTFMKMNEQQKWTRPQNSFIRRPVSFGNQK